MDDIFDAPAAFDGGQEAEQVDQLQQALDLLAAHGAELRAVGGVSRAQVAAMTDAGVAFPAQTPLNAFTADASTTNLNIATESLFGAIWTKLREFARSVLELLRKIFRWIVDTLKSLRPGRKKVEDKAANVQAMAEAVDELKQAGVGVAELTPSDRSKVQQLQDKLSALQNTFATSFNDLMADHVSGGAIASKYRAILLYLPAVTDTYDLGVKQFIEAVKVSDQEAASAGMFAAMADPQKFPKLTDMSRALCGASHDGSATTLAGVAGRLKDYFEQLKQTHTFEAPALSAVTTVLAATKVPLGASTFLNEQVLSKSSERVNGALDEAIRALSTFKEIQGENPISKAMHAALMTIQAEGNAIQTLVTLGWDIDKSQSELIDFAWQHWTLTYQVSLIFAKAADEKTKAEAQRIHLRLGQRLRK
jgi:hypothetical protein